MARTALTPERESECTPTSIHPARSFTLKRRSTSRIFHRLSKDDFDGAHHPDGAATSAIKFPSRMLRHVAHPHDALRHFGEHYAVEQATTRLYVRGDGHVATESRSGGRARKAKHQKPALQQQWQAEITRLKGLLQL